MHSLIGPNGGEIWHGGGGSNYVAYNGHRLIWKGLSDYVDGQVGDTGKTDLD